MIGSLRGKIIYRGLDRVEIDANGIGWEVIMPQNDLARIDALRGKTTAAEIFVHHHVAEDRDELYGFLDRQDKEVFEMLLSVSGIGPKTATAIFSAGNGERIIRAIAEADVEFFRQVKGLGEKGAKRIIVDLKSKAGAVKDLDLEKETSAEGAVYQALAGLGFRRQEIRETLKNLPRQLLTDEDKIKWALRQIGKQR